MVFYSSSSTSLILLASGVWPCLFSYIYLILSYSYLNVLTLFSKSLSFSSSSHSSFFTFSYNFDCSVDDSDFSLAAYINNGILLGFLDLIVSSNSLHFFSKSFAFLFSSSNFLVFSLKATISLKTLCFS